MKRILALLLCMIICCCSFPSFAATVGEQNALASAHSYLKLFNFSYQRLIEQLEYEGYTLSEATYAVDHCGANWKKQALGSAKNYLRTMPFSKESLFDQLIYEKFTNEEARYGVNHCGADWSEQAVRCAKQYLKTMPFSRDALKKQLLYEKFTEKQAEYGVAVAYNEIPEDTTLVTSIKLNKSKATMKTGEKLQLLIKKITPASATNKKVKWSTNNKKVATVDKNGNVKAKGKGTCIITCSATDGSGVSATCKITVK